jgi:hypothetical protein
MTSKMKPDDDQLQVTSTLAEIGNVDTVYRDVYLERARTLMGAVLSLEEFQSLEQQQAGLAELPLPIGRAIEKADWTRVKELSGRGQVLRRAVEGKRRLAETARDIYAVDDVRLDPFSPGLQPFINLSTKNLSALRARAIERLAALERMDAPTRDFYTARRTAFEALVLGAWERSPDADAGTDARAAATQALKRGDMSRLEKLANTLISGGAVSSKTTSRGAVAAPSREAAPPPADLLFAYSADTMAGARRLGLAPRRLESRVEIASLRQYAWNPLFVDESDRIGGKDVPLPAGTPEGFRERLEILMIHPLVNSGGSRHLPKLLAEDVLIEDFPDLKEDDNPPASDLLVALGLPSRRGLTRMAIEHALLARGSRIVSDELRLDPRTFRLVCIPPDVHLRLGEAEGWGRQPLWTHFDGYLVMRNGRLRALAGGDVRFGGLYDLLGLGRDYDSDRVVVRFAVVRRERMVSW